MAANKGLFCRASRSIRLPALLLCLIAVCLLNGDLSSAGQKAVKTSRESCLVKWMKVVGIDRRYAIRYEANIRTAEKHFPNILRGDRVKAASFLPLMLGAHAGKSTALLQCIRKERKQCRKPSPCRHNGDCVYSKRDDRFECKCLKEYKGDFCQSKVNACASNPCKNGGTCYNHVTKFTCRCPIEYDGPTCKNRWFSKSFFTQIGNTLKKIVHAQNGMIGNTLKKIVNAQKGMQSKIASMQKQTNVMKTDLTDLKMVHDITGGLAGGGWRLVWKHSYFQIDKSQLNKMKTFSSFRMPCVTLSDGWCNEPNKQVGASEQMTVAYHKRQVIYAYRSDLNPELGKTWRGVILKDPVKIVDKCTIHNGVPPEPTWSNTRGITFDKANPGRYIDNCDTDQGYRFDCRWDNCYLPRGISPKKNHVQMTVAIFVR